MKGKYLRIIFALVLALSLCLVTAVPVAAADTITVDAAGGGDYTTIQAAIDASGPGDTINVIAGTYTEDLVIPDTKAGLELAGADGTTIQGVLNTTVEDWPGGPANIEILAEGVKIHGFTIQGPAYEAGYCSLGMVIGAANVEIYDNNFEATGAETFGEISQTIQTYDEEAMPDADISGLFIHDNNFAALDDSTAGYEAIYVNCDAGTGNVTIANNSFTGKVLRAITTERSHTNIIQNNIVTELLSGDTPGVGYGYMGILVGDYSERDQDSVEVIANMVTGLEDVNGFNLGIQIGMGEQTLTNVHVMDNMVQMNDVGVMVMSSAGGVVVNYNGMVGNVHHGLYNNVDAVELDAEFNWWGDYGGPGADWDEDLVPGDAVHGTVDYIPWYPMAWLDKDFYQTGDTVTVAVHDFTKEGTGGVSIYAKSTIHAQMGPVALAETDPGLFEGTFTLVDSTPGTGELLVGDGSVIKVGYPDLTFIKTQATVDDSNPEVTIIAPEDGDLVSGDSVSIEADIDEPNIETELVKINGEEVATDVPYTWDTTLEDDGDYNITVEVTDGAGNVGSDSIDVIVDNTGPDIADPASDPEVILPATETEVVFTATVTDSASGVDTVKINIQPIGGSSALAMLDDGVAPDVTADDDIYTASEDITKTAEGNYDLTITATDEAGNISTESITLGVWSDITDPVITSPAITYEYGSSARPGDSVIISANVTDDIGIGPSGNVTVTCDVFIDTIELLDNGVLPDVTADDGIYTIEAEVDEAVGWGDYTITLTATDDKGNDAIDESLTLAVRSGATGYELELVEGWNLISLPLILNNSDIAVVVSVDTLVSGNVSHIGIIRGYDPATGEFPYYIPESGSGDLTVMEDGIGYWVFMEEDDTLTITGRQMPTPPEVPPTYDVVVGWNLIGFKSLVDMIDYGLGPPETGYLLNIAGTYPVLWSYNATAGAYSNVKGIAGGMEVGHGFWIWITEAGTIVPPQ